MSMILHCGSSQATRAQVEAIPVPVHTDSWRPVPYADTIGYMHELAERVLGLPVRSERYGLNKEGNQMFGLISLDTGDTEKGLCFGLRGSYNKSLANAGVAGAQVLVCDNLCLSGDAFKVVRRNTKNVWEDFKTMIRLQMDKSLEHYANMGKSIQAMKDRPCNERRGYAFLGVAQGEGVLTPTQATVAFKDWKTPRHEEFADRNVWGLYNCVTEGLKKGQPGTILDRHTRAHDWFENVAMAA